MGPETFERRARARALVWPAACLWACLGLGLWSGAAAASPIRSYTDHDGVVHLTNVKGGAKVARGRSTAVSPRNALVPMVLLDAVVSETAALYNLPRQLVKAVIATESNYNPWAVSEKGAIGLMQLMPETAREMYVDDPFDPVQNIQGGTRYLRVLVNQFDGDLIKVLAAYNAGPEAVKRSQARGGEFVVPAIPETQDYVRRVMQNYQALKAATAASPAGMDDSGQSDEPAPRTKERS